MHHLEPGVPGKGLDKLLSDGAGSADDGNPLSRAWRLRCHCIHSAHSIPCQLYDGKNRQGQVDRNPLSKRRTAKMTEAVRAETESHGMVAPMATANRAQSGHQG